MLELGNRSRLAHESLSRLLTPQSSGGERLEGRLPSETRMMSQVTVSHSPATQFAENLVPHEDQAVGRLTHRDLLRQSEDFAGPRSQFWPVRKEGVHVDRATIAYLLNEA